MRRIGVIFSAVVVTAWCPFAARAEDWPQFRGPGRDGVWHETGIMQTFPVAGLTIAWRAPVGPGWSSPVVAQGRVYVTDVELAKPVATERVWCFDAVSGKPLWSHRYVAAYPDWAFEAASGGPRSTPIASGDKLYTLGCMGHLFCLDAASGAIVWEKSLAKEYGQAEFTGVTASPLIEDDLLILYICGKPNATVIALEKNTGTEVWRALDDKFTYSSPIILTAGGQRQLIVWTQEAVTSLNPRTGETWWREPVRTPGDSAIAAPVHAGDRLLVSGLMFQLDPIKPAATVLWPASKALGPRILSNTSTPLLQGDHVYAARTTGELVCLDARTGAEAWEATTVTVEGNGSAIHLTPNGDSTLLFTDQGTLIRARLTPAGYEELSRTQLIAPTYDFNGHKRVWPIPAFADGHVFARSDAELVCGDLRLKRD